MDTSGDTGGNMSGRALMIVLTIYVAPVILIVLAIGCVGFLALHGRVSLEWLGSTIPVFGHRAG